MDIRPSTQEKWPTKTEIIDLQCGLKIFNRCVINNLNPILYILLREIIT